MVTTPSTIKNTHRPHVLQLGKETDESLKLYGPLTREMNSFEKSPMNLTVNGQVVRIFVKFRITAVDPEAADAVTGLGGAYCDLCHKMHL